MSSDEQNTDADNSQILRVFSNLFPSYEVQEQLKKICPTLNFFNYSNLENTFVGSKK